MTPTELATTMARLGMTETGLADALGIHRSAVYRWLSGERAIPPYLWRALRDIAREKGIDPFPAP